MARMMMTQTPTTVALLGFEGKQQASMELFLSRYVDGFELAPTKHASTIIFNADQSSDIHQLEQDYQQQYNKPGVVVSAESLQWPGMVSLQKPFGTKELASSLHQLQTQLTSGQHAANEHSESEIKKVLEDFRASVHKGEDLTNGNDNKLNQKKAFQHGLMERKRRAEQLAQNEQTDNPIELLSDLLEQQSTAAAVDFEQDLKAMTAEVIAESHLDLKPGSFAESGYQGVPLLLHPSIEDIQDSCGNQPDYDLSEPTQRRHMFFNPEGQLFAFAFEARKRGQQSDSAQSIIGLPNQHLRYDPVTDEFISTLDYDVLLQMAQARFGFGELQLQTSSDSETDNHDNQHRFNAVAMLWRLACYSAKGRLMEGMSYERRYRLDEKLPSNVIIDLPRTSALIKLWQSESLTAVDVMERLHVEQRFVFPFMTAAISLGWLN